MIKPLKTIALAFIVWGSLLLTSCSLNDERDLCCRQTTLHFRYVRNTTDEYSSYIDNMRHFLFDENGIFIAEIPQNSSSPQDLNLDFLDVGKYTLITIGNAGEQTLIGTLTPGVSSVKDFKIRVRGSSPYGNADPLYWNSNNSDDVTRIFPLSGELRGGEKENMGLMNWYWTSREEKQAPGMYHTFRIDFKDHKTGVNFMAPPSDKFPVRLFSND